MDAILASSNAHHAMRQTKDAASHWIRFQHSSFAANHRLHFSADTSARQIIQRDRSDNLKTLRADFVHRVTRGVPPGIIEIYDVDRRNANSVQRRVIVNQVAVEVGEIISQLQRFRRGKEVSRYFGR